MNESAPAPARPPVPEWERVAAGMLAVGWVVGTVAMRMSPRYWMDDVLVMLGGLSASWEAFIVAPSGHVSTLLESPTIFRGIASAMWLGVHLGMPLLVVLATAVASGRWRRVPSAWLWYACIVNGVMGFAGMISASREDALTPRGPITPTSAAQTWHQGWLSYFLEYPLTYLAELCSIFGGEILLAALVLGIGWWRRRREGEAPAEPK